MKIDTESELEIIISEETVRRRLHEIGLKGRVTRKKPYVNKVNRGKRLEYAKTYREKPLGYWNNALWTDESKFNLFWVGWQSYGVADTRGKHRTFVLLVL